MKIKISVIGAGLMGLQHIKAIEKSSSSPYRAEFLINGTGQPLNSAYSKDGMWLKAGDIIGSTVGTIYDDYMVLSIIEYNIVSE